MIWSILNWPYQISSLRLPITHQIKLAVEILKIRMVQKKRDSGIIFKHKHIDFYWCAKNEYWINSIDNRPPKTYLAFQNDHWYRSRYFHPCGMHVCMCIDVPIYVYILKFDQNEPIIWPHTERDKSFASYNETAKIIFSWF